MCWSTWNFYSLTIIFISNVVQLLSCIWHFVTPWTAAHQAAQSSTIFQSLLKFMSIESVMLSNYLIFWHPLLLLPSIFPSIRVFSNESFHHYIIDEISNILSLILFPILCLYLWPWSPLPPEKRQLLYQVYCVSSPVFLVVLCIDVSKNNINIVLHVFTFTLLHFAICLLMRWRHVNKYVPPSLTFTGW